MQKFKLIVGLGNPDPKYENTYHNVGHLFIDFLGKGIKSETYMNKSGEFVKELVKKNKVKPEQLLIVHDDSDIGLGKYKFSFGRSSAGHKGVQNIIDQLKTQKFWRLRIGIRPAREKVRAKADELVLRQITPAYKKKLGETFKEIIKKISNF